MQAQQGFVSVFLAAPAAFLFLTEQIAFSGLHAQASD
jgi:hypothetical protein